MNQNKRPASHIRFALASILLLLSIHPATPARADESYNRCVDIYQTGSDADNRSDYQTASEKYTEARDYLLKISGGELIQDNTTLLNSINEVYSCLIIMKAGEII